MDESDTEHQKTIKGFFDNAVPGFVKNQNQVSEDAYAWCAAFVNNILNESGFDIPLQGEDIYDKVRAKEYSKIGTKITNKSAKPGDIMVIKNSSGGYHVGFYAGKNNDKYLMLGGNQNNQVNIKELNLDSIEIISFNRIGDFKDLNPEELKKLYSTEYYQSSDGKLITQ